MNLGIDLGSTYTILSTYREDHSKLEAIEADAGNNVNVPSVISLPKKGSIGFGTFAKDKTGKKNTRTFRAFKMLLMENDKNLLRERSYDEEHTPKWALKEFMTLIIDAARESDTIGRSDIDNLVVGAPNVWFHKFDTLGGRAVLKDICTGIEGVKDVRIVSEPVLASAYFAYNYQKKCGEPFDGSILIIDYGGGTLDLSLTNVRKVGSSSMEIKMLAFNGAGENTDHDIGNAGIVFHESLTEHIILKEHPELAGDLRSTEEFYAAVNDLEKVMRQSAVNKEIEEGFKQYKFYLDELEEQELGHTFEYDGEDYIITLADLLTVYNAKIRDTFEEKMDEMIRMAAENGIDVKKALDKNGKKFRIALVGGFGNFYLVREQMQQKFVFSSKDEKAKDIIEAATDRERAISYGAALVASGVVGICNTAPYSIGIRSMLNGKKNVDYMVRYKDEIEIDSIYYIDKLFLLTNDTIDDDFVIESNNKPISIVLKNEYKKRIAKELNAEGGLKTFKIGVSFNNSDFMTLHIKRFLFEKQKESDRDITIELGEIYNAFEEKKEV